MKRYLISALAILVGLAVSCTKPGTSGEGIPEVPKSISFDPAEVVFPVAGGSVSLIIYAPERPVLEDCPAWVTFKEGAYDKTKYKMTATLSANSNYSCEPEMGTIVFSAGSLSGSLKVSQDAGGDPVEPVDPEDPIIPADEYDAALTNPNASAEAKNVYEFLLSIAGEKMLSGVQSGGTANNNDRVNQLFQMTGKHPALAGYDYIFLQYSPTPQGWSWVVNYSDISAQKEQWKNNGLVSMMWHWNVPSTKADWEKGKNGDFSGYNFYSDKTSFSIQNALTSGTWENEFILKDIEKVAGYLKLLQDEGIPVIWRPLHEAAGNYNLYGKTNNAWFWWGRGGADACKSLWKLLRDKLEGEYGLDNLIWVWTLDATPGAEKEWASWYPGNDVVDIVGVDIYADDTDAKERQYKAAAALSAGHKMVTVSECGNIPEPIKCIAAGEKWCWFMAWDLESYSLNTTAYWKNVMASSKVITREDMPSLK